MSHRKKTKIYNAKLLLFGEHTVLRGSNALAAPYSQFGGRWTVSSSGPATNFQHDLFPFCDYLNALQERGELKCPLRIEEFRADLEEGLYFDSDIPVGYGLGSSGALCAAVYDRYCPAKIAPDDTGGFGELKNILAQLESFFHGSSSGTDPLIIYLDHPVLIQPGGHIDRVALPSLVPGSPWRFFLLDTGIRRETGPLVQHFLKKTATSPFSKIFPGGLLQPNNEAIANLLEGHWEALAREVKRISAFQIEELPEMTPEAFHQVWKEGLDADAYYLKLCGAGGGGFLLGYTEDLMRTRETLSARGFSILEVSW